MSIPTITDPESTTGDPGRKSLVTASGKSQLKISPQSPFFSSPPCSTALLLSHGSVCTMLDETVPATAGPGIAFESWVKVEQVAESVLVAYTLERPLRSERAKSEQQTFVLGIPSSSTD